MAGEYPAAAKKKLRAGLVEEAQEGEVLGQVGLDRLDAAVRPLLDPVLGEVVLDAMKDAAGFHTAIFDGRPDERMSRMAHFRGLKSPDCGRVQSNGRLSDRQPPVGRRKEHRRAPREGERARRPRAPA